jgi:hypothetical protein
MSTSGRSGPKNNSLRQARLRRNWYSASRWAKSPWRSIDLMVEEVLDLNDSIQDRKRPFSVTLLAGLVLIITIVHLVRFVYALTLWSFLTNLPGKPPLYLALTGLIGSLAGAVVSWGLWTGKPRAPLATRLLIVVYLVYQWVEQILSVRAGNEFENWPFWTSMTLIILIFVNWTLSHSGAKAYFGEMHEPSKEDPRPSPSES